MIQIDEIGVINNYSPDSDTYSAIKGWHVNSSHPVIEWSKQKVTPSTPRRVFGGIPTYFYTFDSKEAFDSILQVTNLDITPESIPNSVTRRQARQALFLSGLLNKVQPAIDSIVDANQRMLVQIEWDDSQVFERNRPVLMALASALGMSNADLDNLFIQANKL